MVPFTPGVKMCFFVIRLQSDSTWPHTFTRGIYVRLWCPHLAPVAIQSCAFPLTDISSSRLFKCFFFYNMFPPAGLLHVDSRCICIYTCVQCGHNASLTTFRSGLDRITIRPQFDSFWVFLHLYFNEVKRYLFAIRSEKVHFNTRCEGGQCVWFSGFSASLDEGWFSVL